MIEILGWIVLSVVVGVVAQIRGRLGVGWFLLALLISPLISGIILAFIPNLRVLADQQTQRDLDQLNKDAEWSAAMARAAQESARMTGQDLTLAIEQLRLLRDRKMLSQIEFDARKQKLIQDLEQKYITQKPEEFLVALVPLVDSGTLSDLDIHAIKQALAR